MITTMDIDEELSGLWDFTDPVGSLARLRQARDAATGTRRAVLGTQVARAHGLSDDVAAGDAELDAVDIADPVVAQRVALERGRLRMTGGDPAAAREQFVAAADGPDEALVVDAVHMLAIVDTAAEADWTERGLALARASSDPRVVRWEGPLLNNHGWNHADTGRDAEALAVLREAEAWYAEHGTTRQQQNARDYVADLLRRVEG